jgi:acetyl esterase
MDLNPQVRALLDSMAAVPPPDFATLTASAYRASLSTVPGFAPGDEIAQQTDITIQGAAGPLKARLYRPGLEGPSPCSIWRRSHCESVLRL